MVEKKKKKVAKKKQIKKDSEKVCEVFEVSEDGKEKIVKTCGEMPVKHASKEEIQKANETLRNILIGIGIFVLVFVITIFAVNNINKVDYKEVKFNAVDENGKTFYHTSFPIFKENQVITYNVFLRKNPAKNKIPFEGELEIGKAMIQNFEDGFVCDGYGVVAIANLNSLYNSIGIETGRDSNATCDEYGRYMYLNFIPSDKSKIVQIGPACYEMHIKDCEIIAVTEKFMLETLSLINEVQKN